MARISAILKHRLSHLRCRQPTPPIVDVCLFGEKNDLARTGLFTGVLVLDDEEVTVIRLLDHPDHQFATDDDSPRTVAYPKIEYWVRRRQ